MLVETNVISDLVRQRPNAAVTAWAEAQRRMQLSIVTVEEIPFAPK